MENATSSETTITVEFQEPKPRRKREPKGVRGIFERKLPHPGNGDALQSPFPAAPASGRGADGGTIYRAGRRHSRTNSSRRLGAIG
jgi:hypothetical protein